MLMSGLRMQQPTVPRIAVDEIVSLNTAHCNANGIAIGVGVTAQVEQAYNLGIVTTAAARNAAVGGE